MTGIEAVPELQSNHEEADTRMILRAKHVQGPSIIYAENTDVLVLILSHSNTLDAAYMKAGRGSKSRIINIKSVRDQIAKDLPPGTSLQDFLKSLIGLHALTGCDNVSAFAGKGKSKAFKMLMKNGKYVRAFMNIGISWNVSSKLFSVIEEFVCDLHGKKNEKCKLVTLIERCLHNNTIILDYAP